MNDPFRPPPDNNAEENQPWNSPGGRTLANVVGIVVVVLALFVWADSMTFGDRFELRLAKWFVMLALAFAGVFMFRRWLRRRRDKPLE